jgi:hypothetical protein
MLEAAVVILVLAVLLAVVVAALLQDDAAVRRRQIERRARMTELEIDEIGRRTQQAILAEALRRRALNQPRR